MGVGGMGLGVWGMAPTPQPPIPNPQSPIPILVKYKINTKFNNNLIINDLIIF
jgi:hypothetical protein